jgi:hypothetical protein
MASFALIYGHGRTINRANMAVVSVVTVVVRFTNSLTVVMMSIRMPILVLMRVEGLVSLIVTVGWSARGYLSLRDRVAAVMVW